MEQEKIVAEIITKIGETPLSERTIKEYIGVNMPKEGEEFDFDKHSSILKSMGGQLRFDLKNGIEDFKKNYNPNPEPPKKEEPKMEDPELKALEEEMSKLKEMLSAKDAKETHETIKAKVIEEMRKQKATDDYVLNATFKGVTLDVKKSVDELTKEMLKSYDEEFKACRGNGASPRNGENGGGGKGKTSADIFFANKKKSEGYGK